MGTLSFNGSALGTALQSFLTTDDVQPGTEASYELCKTIFLYHPLGAKMVEEPIRIAQSQRRKITVPDGPEEMVVEAFEREWSKLNVDSLIFNLVRIGRIYGVGSIVYGADGVPADKPVDPFDLAKHALFFNVLDPLNTAGSLIFNQDPNAPDFQKPIAVSVQGTTYHRSRTCVFLNESPIYIAYTSSAFGYVGRSVYQRVLYPLKSFVQSMRTDDMVVRKAGVLIAKMKQAGSIINQIMSSIFAAKRQMLVEAETDNVLGISTEESIESLNLQNVDGANTAARRNIIENIATGTPMPAKLLLQESFAEGFGEGTEDAKHIAQFIDDFRIGLKPVYDFFDRIVQHRAWNEEFYKTIQRIAPEYEGIPYKQAFFAWQNSFAAEWPSLITEPDSEKIKVDETKGKNIVSILEVFMPNVSPTAKARLLEWAADNLNENKLLFTTPLVLDWEEIAEFLGEQDEMAKQQQEQAAQGGAGGAEGGPGEPEGTEGLSPPETGKKQPKPPAPQGLQRAA